VAAISWNVLWVGTGWVPARAGAEVTKRSGAATNTIARAGAVLGRMLGAGSGLPVAFQRFYRDKRQASRR
jgi:hypothetical protein